MSKKLTQEEFISRAKEVHGNKYDYSKTKYTSLKDKVCIICKKHGEFWQKASHHLSGHQCSKCAAEERSKEKTKTNENFIEDAKKVHGEKYDYSKTNYKNSNSKVCIICPEHGEFWQEAGGHLQGAGCPKCGKISMAEKIRKEVSSFIEEVKEVHGNKYDYSEIEYIDQVTKIKVKCNHCNNYFWIAPRGLLNGNGCPYCANLARSIKLKHNTTIFIESAKKVHGNKYDYSKSNYIDAETEVCIICEKHGEFWQKPHTHLKGSGCPLCAKESFLDKTKTPINEAKEIIKNKFGDRYVLIDNTYISFTSEALFIDTEDGNLQFKISPIHLLSRKRLHPDRKFECECLVKDWLNDKLIKFIHGYKVEGIIRNVYPVKIDFYIPDKNIWIEYNGLQHYEFVEYFHSNIEGFKTQLIRDEKVRNYCKINNIFLIEVPYIYNTKETIYKFLDDVIINNIDPNTIVNYESLFKRPSDYIPYSENKNN